MNSGTTGSHRSSLSIVLVFILGLLGVIFSRESLTAVRFPATSFRVATPGVRIPQSSTRTQSVKLQEGWWTPYVNSTARVYDSWDAGGKGKNAYEWCIPIDRSNKDRFPPPEVETIGGLIYMKLYKAASSTCEGINIAIAHHTLRRKDNFSSSDLPEKKCQHYNRHVFAEKRLHNKRDRERSVLWSFVRNPRSRDISALNFFHVSRIGTLPNQTDVLLPVLETQRSFQSRFLAPGPPMRALQPAVTNESHYEISQAVQRVFQYYDFLGVTERMTESLAVMTLLWNLDPTSVIVLSAKHTEAFDDGGYNKTCTRVQKPDLHPDLDLYLSSSRYLEGNADYLLYAISLASLDLTIQRLGYNVVQERAELIEKLQRIAEDKCRAHAIFPCSQNGTLQLEVSNISCYVQDAGCGHACVDKTMEPCRMPP